LLFRFDGSLLLRFDARQLVPLLFQLPPRITRAEPCDRSPASPLARLAESANRKGPPSA